MVLRAAARARAHVPGLARLGRRAAVRAEAVAAVPVEQRRRVGDHPALGLREHGARSRRPTPLAAKLVARVGREDGATVAVDAEQHELEAVRELVDARAAAGRSPATSTPASLATTTRVAGSARRAASHASSRRCGPARSSAVARERVGPAKRG